MKIENPNNRIECVCLSLFILINVSLFLGCGAGPSDFSDDLGNGYYYYRSSPLDCFIAPKEWNDRTPMIPSKIVRYITHDGYIMAKRGILEKAKSGSRIASGKYDYWILETKVPLVYGPMDKKEFESRGNTLGLSKGVTFIN